MTSSALRSWRNHARRRAFGPCSTSRPVSGPGCSRTASPTRDGDPARARRQHLRDAVLHAGGQRGELGPADESHEHRLGHLDAADLRLLHRDGPRRHQPGGEVQRAVLAHEPEAPPLQDVAGDGDDQPEGECADGEHERDGGDGELGEPLPRRGGRLLVPDGEVVGELRQHPEPAEQQHQPAEAEGREAQPGPVDPRERHRRRGQGSRGHGAVGPVGLGELVGLVGLVGRQAVGPAHGSRRGAAPRRRAASAASYAVPGRRRRRGRRA